jgi:DNA-binding IclR family transcriptional regulator
MNAERRKVTYYVGLSVRILAILRKQRRLRMTVTELADDIGASPMYTAAAVKHLVDYGFIYYDRHKPIMYEINPKHWECPVAL